MFGKGVRSQSALPPRRRCLRVEALENRRLLAVITVNTDLDVTDAFASAVSAGAEKVTFGITSPDTISVTTPAMAFSLGSSGNGLLKE